MKMRHVISAVLSVMLAMASAPGVSAEPDRIKIGLLAPLTGAGAPYGPIEAKAAKAAADYINRGGGVLGKKLEIVVADAEGNPTAGVAAARKLIDANGVVAIAGIWSSAVGLAVKPIALQRGVAIYLNGAANEFTEGGNDQGLAWRFMAPGNDWGTALGKAAAIHKPKTVSVLILQNPFTLSFLKNFTAEIEAVGAKVIDVVRYNANQPSYRAEVEKAFGSEPDLVVIPGYITDFTAISREVYRNGYTSQILTLTQAADSQGQFTRDVGKDVAEGIDNIIPVPDDGSKTFALYRKLAQVAKNSTEIFGPSVFDQVVLTALAIERAKSSDARIFAPLLPSLVNGPGKTLNDPVDAPKAIREGKPFRYGGAFANFTFCRNGDPTNVAFGFHHLHDGVNTLQRRLK